ncbi:MAG: hypothetical protein HY020_14190 [Burkholderiales bacterium]|nr:hypothetical protein [Burkholderiales bacterium]
MRDAGRVGIGHGANIRFLSAVQLSPDDERANVTTGDGVLTRYRLPPQ